MPNLARRSNLSGLADYSVLLARVRETFILGLRKAEELKVQTYWEAGRLIHEHLRHHQDEAGYGHQLMPKLARALGVGDRLLYRMLRFYEAFPERPILSGRTKLTWTHYRALARLPDKKKRLQIEACAAREHWNAEKLEKHIRFITDTAPATTPEPSSRPVQLLTPKRGKLGLYRIVPDGDGLAVDLGFTSYQTFNSQHSTLNPQLKANDLVTLARNGQPIPAPAATKADLYTYTAEILRVVDGDTLILKIWLKPGLWLKEKVRLRGIDCPELDTPEGRAAKRFVEGLVKKAESVTITTTKPDKWDRYLCDMFLSPSAPRGEVPRLPAATARQSGESDGREVRGEGNLNTISPTRVEGVSGAQAEELFLNNALLENGHARRYDKVRPADWEQE